MYFQICRKCIWKAKLLSVARPYVRFAFNPGKSPESPPVARHPAANPPVGDACIERAMAEDAANERAAAEPGMSGGADSGAAPGIRGRQAVGAADTGSRPVSLSSRNDRFDVTLFTPGSFLTTVSRNRL